MTEIDELFSSFSEQNETSKAAQRKQKNIIRKYAEKEEEEEKNKDTHGNKKKQKKNEEVKSIISIDNEKGKQAVFSSSSSSISSVQEISEKNEVGEDNSLSKPLEENEEKNKKGKNAVLSSFSAVSSETRIDTSLPPNSTVLLNLKKEKEESEEEKEEEGNADTAAATGDTNLSKSNKRGGLSYSDIIVEKYESDLNCIHECALPANYKRTSSVFSSPSSSSLSSSSSNDIPVVVKTESEVTNLPKKPAKEYKYKLDAFQAKSIQCLEEGESVLVSAHTSAGKTCVAEYAIAMSIRDKQRVIYTSPIKALSNQKYRDLSDEFKDVGLMTGDVTLNPNSSLIVMTTEILRSMLYRGSELVREMKWVIFDEIHYMRDRDRGVVWEETIILLPLDVRIVFLSATIPNATEFALWVATIKQQPCHVIYTDFRPTPLQHFMFPAGGDGVFLVMDEHKKFRHDNFQKAIQALTHGVTEMQISTKQQMKKNKMRTKSDIEKIVQMCYHRQYTPVIVFSFSKRDCEGNATAMKRIDLTDDNEKSLIEEIYANAIATLSEEDRELPQVKFMLPLLRRGIGIHHGGLLPIVKEVVEILFQESLLKVLFSTETFSMGINMPAKTVVFTSVRKWDGVEYRLVNSGEFIQMAGRAGRRGLDDRGLTIIMLDEQVEPEDAKKIFTGEALRLDSQFKLGYNMILNLFKIEGYNPIFMLQKSFYQFQKDRSIASIEEEKSRLEKDIVKMCDIRNLVLREEEEKRKKKQINKKVEEPDCDVNKCIAEYYETKRDIIKYSEDMQSLITSDENLIRFLQSGRLLEIKQKDGYYWGWGVCCRVYKKNIQTKVVTSFNKLKEKEDKEPSSSSLCSSYVADVFIRCASDSLKSLTEMQQNNLTNEQLKSYDIRPPVKKKKQRKADEKNEEEKEKEKEKDGGLLSSSSSDEEGALEEESDDALEAFQWEVLPFTLSSILHVSKVRMNMPLSASIKSMDAKAALSYQFDLIKKKMDGQFPLLDPIKHMNIQNPQLLTIIQRIKDKEIVLAKSPLHSHPLLSAYYRKYEELVSARTRLRNMESIVLSSKHLAMKNELKNMRSVLKRLNYLDEKNVVTLKGRIACEVSTCDELVLSELIFQNIFEEMHVDYICAILSCLVFDDKCEEMFLTDPILIYGFDKIKEIARNVATVSAECKLPVTVDEYLDKFKPALMNIVLGWMRGAKFADLLADTTLFEGSIIRAMRRLEELLRQLCATSRSIGNEPLEKKFLEAICKLKRGIVFAASLYIYINA